MKRRGQGLLIAIGSGKPNRDKEEEDHEDDEEGAAEDDEREAACDEAVEALISALHARDKDEVKDALRAFLASEEY